MQVELEELARELAGRDQVAVVGREVHVVGALAPDRHPLDQAEGVRIAEVQRPPGFGDDDGGLPVRREVQVVGIVDGKGLPGFGRLRVDGRERVAQVVVDIEGLQVP